jgi:spermidine/putrescine-binding protein
MVKKCVKPGALAVILLVVLALVSAACGPGAPAVKELVVYTWVGYDDETFWNHPDDPMAFYKIYDEEEVDVKYDFYHDVDALYSHISLDRDFAEVIEIYSADLNLWYDPADPLLEPLDLDLLPYWDDVLPGLKNWTNIWTDDDRLLLAPKYFGHTIIMYRHDLLTGAGINLTDSTEWPNPIEVLFSDNPALEGKICLYDSGDESVPHLALAAGYTPEQIWTDNVTAFDAMADDVKAEWEAAGANFASPWTLWEEAITKIANGEVWMINGWNDMYLWSALELVAENATGEEVKEVLNYIPGQAMIGWYGGHTIRAGLDEDDTFLWEAAHALINAHMSKPSSMYMLEEWAFGSAHKDAPAEAVPYADWYIEEFNFDDPATFYAPTAHLWGSTPAEIHEARSTLWSVLKGML